MYWPFDFRERWHKSPYSEAELVPLLQYLGEDLPAWSLGQVRGKRSIDQKE